MSKIDALRAMREAKYAANSARVSSRPAPRATPAKPVPPAPAATTPQAGEPVAAATDELCGHRNMSGRTCTRERGHTAKSHRYS